MSENDNNKKIIASRLKMAREHAGLSQGQVAKMMNMHRPSISEIEAGRRSVSSEELVGFSRIYNVRTNWVLSEDDDTGNSVKAKVELAARELSSLKNEDLDKILNLLSALRKPDERG